MSAMNPGAANVDVGSLIAQWRTAGKQGALTDYMAEALAPVAGQGRAATDDDSYDVVLYGFGRIGRLLARILVAKSENGRGPRLRAIVVREGGPNDLIKRASLLRRDSVHGPFHGTITVDAGAGDIEVGTAGTTLYLGVEWGTEAGTYPDGYWNHDKLGWGTTNFFADNFGAICFDHDPRYWIKGQTYEQNYGTSIGSDSVTPVIILENRILCNGTSAGTWYAGYPGDPEIDLHCNHNINADGVYKVDGVQVVGTQGTYDPAYGPPFGATGIADGEAGTPYAAVSELQTAFDRIRDIDSRITNIVYVLTAHGLMVDNTLR
jgi:hypothetical protein